MAEYSGKDLVIQWGGTVISSDFRTLATTETADEIDASAGNDTRKVFLAGMTAGQATGGFIDLTAGTVNWNVLAPQNSGTLEWAPEGTASTKPRYYASAVVLGRNRSFPYNDVVSYDITWRLSGTITQTAY